MYEFEGQDSGVVRGGEVQFQVWSAYPILMYVYGRLHTEIPIQSSWQGRGARESSWRVRESSPVWRGCGSDWRAVEVWAVVCVWCVLCVVVRELVLGGPASEARVVGTFSANDAAYLTLSRAVSQLRRCESVPGGGGLLSCVCVGLFLK